MLETEVIQSRRGGFTRRKFIKGVIAAGATVSATGYLFRGSGLAAPMPSAQGAVERLITLNVNGQQRRVDVPKQETLAMTLRYQLGLTGTKLGCDRAECGACTVVIDGGHPLRLLDPDALCAGPGGHHHRRVGAGRTASPGPTGRHGRGRLPVRLLRPRLHHEHGRHAGEEPEPDPRRGRPPSVGQPLPVRRLRQDSEHGDAGGRAVPLPRIGMAARGRNPTAFDRRCIRAGRWRSALLLGRIALLFPLRHALPARRLAGLGATRGFTTDCRRKVNRHG